MRLAELKRLYESEDRPKVMKVVRKGSSTSGDLYHWICTLLDGRKFETVFEKGYSHQEALSRAQWLIDNNLVPEPGATRWL